MAKLENREGRLVVWVEIGKYLGSRGFPVWFWFALKVWASLKSQYHQSKIEARMVD